jgi:serine/threonine protein kinase
VALKVLPFAATLDPRRLQRFHNEARAAASLHHPNIVPVYAVGAVRGVHYYAMQLIEGQNLAVLLADLRRSVQPNEPNAARSTLGSEATGPDAAPPPADGLTADTRQVIGAQLSTQRSVRSSEYFRTVVSLIAQAAEGLDYAHGLGIIHRDVKPANLIVDARRNVWLTDFGLAQFRADAGLTLTGDLVGTLHYMSPEQAGGQRALIDHRTDVYSLGATFYELLTLRPIFDGPDRPVLLHQILHDEPRAPRSIDKTIPPELETIVLKAVSKAPAERYPTIREFADDLHHFLRNEPITARLPTLPQRARKWLRRHPSVLVASIILLVLLSAGSLVSAWLIRGSYERERLRAEEAEVRFQLAKQSVDEMIQLAQEDLIDKPHMEGLRRRLLEAALAYYQKFIELRRDEPGAEDLELTRNQVKAIVDDLTVLQGAGQPFLLKNAEVLNDLNLSEQQRQGVGELMSRLGEQRDKIFGKFHTLTKEQRDKQFLDMARGNEAAVAEILRPPQVRRLRQIALQSQGPMAFRDPNVAAALKLTAQQKERIRAIEAETFFRPPERKPSGPSSGRKPGGPNSEEQRKANEQRWKKATADMLAVLTPEQTTQWREMTGKPFRGSLFFPPMGLFGPPR